MKTHDKANRMRDRFSQRLRSLVAASLWLLGSAWASADTVIVQDTFYYEGWAQHLNADNRAPDTVNLPATNWVVVARWPWAYDPYIPGTGWGYWPQHTVYMQQGLNSISVGIAGYNTGHLRIAADLAIETLTKPEGIALGFKVSAPASGYVTGVDPAADFTGIRINGDGVVAVVVNGVAQSGAVSAGALTDKVYYPLSYDIDTDTGDIFNIKFNGSSLPDFATTAFVPAAMLHAAVLTGSDCKGAVDNFTVTAVETIAAPPQVDNANGATDVIGTTATLHGTLLGGGPADVSVYYGTDPGNWSHTNHLGTLQDGLFSTPASGLGHSTVYYYQCFASNAVGTAWAPSATNFLSGARGFTWTGAAENGLWNDAGNWDPNTGFPNGSRETATFIHSESTPTTTVYLNQASITVGGIFMTPGAGFAAGFTVATNGPGQTLAMDNGDDRAFINVLGGVTGGGMIAAPVLLAGDLEVSTTTSGNNYALTFAGPVSGSGEIVAKVGRIGLDPVVDMAYGVTFSVAKTGGAVWKRGTKAATFTGTSSVLLAGDANTAGMIGGGGAFVVSGGVLTNPSTTGSKYLFASAGGNALVVTNGGQLIYATVDGSYPQVDFNAENNKVVIAGAGSRLNLNNSAMRLNSSGGRLVVAEGGQLLGRQGHIGWRTSNNTVLVTGSSSLWDLNNQSLCMGVGSPASSNALIIADGAVVQNTFLWMGYSYYNEGGGSYNSLVVTNGGKFYSGSDQDWGWGSCVGVSGQGSGYKAHDNTALITGTGSLWDMQTKNFSIGFINSTRNDISEIVTGGWNRVQAELGGAITNVNTLYIGKTAVSYVTSLCLSYSNTLTVADGGAVSASAVFVGGTNATGNAVILDGGNLSAATFTVNAGNSITPVIDEDGLAPIAVSGTATFEAGSLVTPTPLEDGPLGVYTLVTAGTIVDGGLALDPAADPAAWHLVVDETSVVLRHALPHTLFLLR